MDKIKALIAPQIETVNSIIINQLSSDVALINDIGIYIVKAGGKRLRPILTLLSAAAIMERPDVSGLHLTGLKLTETFAAIIEFIHTATLLHDDVVDSSQLRRGKYTANAKWSNASSVLVGDFIYSRAFMLLVKTQNLELMNLVAQTTNIIAEGEVLQLANIGNDNLNEEDYLEVIKRKTAILFAAATEGAAILKQCNETTQLALKTFGLHLGIAFQIMDDALDYQGASVVMGKNHGDDFAEGKLTLPLIYALKQATLEQQDFIKHALHTKNMAAFGQVLQIINEYNALQYSIDCAQYHAELAQQALGTLAPSQYRDALMKLANLSVSRQS